MNVLPPPRHRQSRSRRIAIRRRADQIRATLCLIAPIISLWVLAPGCQRDDWRAPPPAEFTHNDKDGSGFDGPTGTWCTPPAACSWRRTRRLWLRFSRIGRGGAWSRSSFMVHPTPTPIRSTARSCAARSGSRAGIYRWNNTGPAERDSTRRCSSGSFPPTKSLFVKATAV